MLKKEFRSRLTRDITNYIMNGIDANFNTNITININAHITNSTTSQVSNAAANSSSCTSHPGEHVVAVYHNILRQERPRGAWWQKLRTLPGQ